MEISGSPSARCISLIVFLFISVLNSFSQCSWTPAIPAVGGCTGTRINAGNAGNINGGTNFYHDGGNLTVNLGINGGTLRICSGTLSTANLNFNSGTIIIEEGGTFNYTGGNKDLNGNTTIVNRGTLNWSNNLKFQNNSNFLYNLNNGNFTITGELENSNNMSGIYIGHNINTGSFNVSSLRLQNVADGSLCFLPEGCISINGNINNNSPDVADIDGDGIAAIYYSGEANLNQRWTDDANMNICLAPGATTTGGGGWGNAELNANCASCEALLPVSLLYFKGEAISGKRNRLTWATSSETNNDRFEIHKSNDGQNWKKINSVRGAGDSNEEIYYQFTDTEAEEFTYYKLIQYDYDGAFEVFDIIKVEGEHSNIEQASLYPNPSTGGTITVTSSSRIKTIEVLTISGKKLRTIDDLNMNQHQLLLERSGVYLIKVETLLGNIQMLKAYVN